MFIVVMATFMNPALFTVVPEQKDRVSLNDWQRHSSRSDVEGADWTVRRRSLPPHWSARLRVLALARSGVTLSGLLQLPTR